MVESTKQLPLTSHNTGRLGTMSSKGIIAVDILGGDFAPNAILAGALQAARAGIPLLLVGPREVSTAFFARWAGSDRRLPIEFFDASEAIGMEEEPVEAVKRKPHSSLVTAVRLHAENKVSAVVSAGNSGALMAAGVLFCKKQKGIERPAIASFLPTITGKPCLALDIGANVQCKPHYLLQFAELGCQYLQSYASAMPPRVGLLSNGSERGKGTVLIKEAFELLEASEMTFVGNVEPLDIVQNKVDVVVSDGFSGNILIKSMEATIHLMKIFFQKRTPATFSFEGLRNLTTFLEENMQTGAPLLGIQGTIIVAHGNADYSAIAGAIEKAYESSK